MTTPKAKLAGLALIAALCAGGILGLTAPAARHSSRYCRTHERRARLYGHPQGGQIDRKMLRSYRQQMADFIDTHFDTPQVQAAVALLDDMLKYGLPKELPAWRHSQHKQSDVAQRIRDLRDQGVTGQEALEILGGVWLLAYREPRVLPDDLRLTYRLALELMKARTLPTRLYHSPTAGRMLSRTSHPGSLPRKAIGGFVRRRLGVFFMRVIEALDAEDRYAMQQAQTLAAPFIPITTTTIEELEQ